MAKRRRIRWDRVILVFGPIILLIIIICVSCNRRPDTEDTSQPDPSSAVTTPAAEVTVPVMTGEVIPAQAAKTEFVIVVDAGHGGDDTGANNQEVTRFEKNDNLNLALAVRDALQKYPDIRVIMTRDTDVFVELQDRCDIANNANADFFISIHRNSSVSGSGVEIWINNDAGGDNSWDKLLAEYIMELLDDVGISLNRGIKSGYRSGAANRESNNYYVNRYTNMPSCLIEMGFMTSDIDNQNFDNRLDAYADAIATAVIELVTDKGLYPFDTAE